MRDANMSSRAGRGFATAAADETSARARVGTHRVGRRGATAPALACIANIAHCKRGVPSDPTGGAVISHRRKRGESDRIAYSVLSRADSLVALRGSQSFQSRAEKLCYR
jgi:hypothetical protein